MQKVAYRLLKFSSKWRYAMRLSTALTLIGLASASLGMAINATPARAGVCEDLWVQRNSIYKSYGYCFKTAKAKNYFGNAGCAYNNAANIPMSRGDKQSVLAIKKREKALGCL